MPKARGMCPSELIAKIVRSADNELQKLRIIHTQKSKLRSVRGLQEHVTYCRANTQMRKWLKFNCKTL